MRYPLCIVLVILVFSTSLNQGQKLRSNERRAAGLVPYPRIGRHLAMASFARSDGNAGLVNYPRVGRSGSMAALAGDSNGPDFETEPRIDIGGDFDIGVVDDFDYTGPHPGDWDESRKRFEAMRNSGMWLGSQPSTGEKKERRMHRCNQQIDGPWAVLFSTRDLSSLDQQPVHNFIPRVVREVEHDASTSHIVS